MRAYFLLLSALLLVSSHAAEIRIADPVGNLTGNTKRGYMDITEVVIRQETASLSVRIEVDQPFPEASTLLGTGMQFVFRFLDVDENAPVILACSLELTDQGWSINRIGNYTERLPVDFRIGPANVSLEIPVSLIGNVNKLEITADTANRPKWRPVTANPTITVDLPPPPQHPETASH